MYGLGFETELEGEGELEGEYEGEQFFGSLARLARRAARSPALRRVGLNAARAALAGFRNVGTAIGGSLAGRGGAQLGGQFGGRLAGYVGGMLPPSEAEFELENESELELEGEGELELEVELKPIRQVYPEALMEHLGHAATLARNEAEAEAFIGALVPLATTLLPRLAPSAARVASRAIPQTVGMMRNLAPRLISGVARTTRVLRRNPATRQLVRILPAVVRGTVSDIARQYAGGQLVTPQSAGRTLARHTARVLSNPRTAVQVYRRSRALDRQYHQSAGPLPTGSAADARPRCRCAG